MSWLRAAQPAFNSEDFDLFTSSEVAQACSKHWQARQAICIPFTDGSQWCRRRSLPYCRGVFMSKQTGERIYPKPLWDGPIKGDGMAHTALYRLTLSIRNRAASALCAALQDRQVGGIPAVRMAAISSR